MTTQMYQNLYCSEIFPSKIAFAPSRDIHCFFIVNQPHDKEAIREQAAHYLNSQCRRYDFFGTYRMEWELIFDDADIERYPDGCYDDDIALTSSWDDIDQFADVLALAVAISTRAEQDVYLFYDDEAVFQEVLIKLKESLVEDTEGNVFLRDDE